MPVSLYWMWALSLKRIRIAFLKIVSVIFSVNVSFVGIVIVMDTSKSMYASYGFGLTPSAKLI